MPDRQKLTLATLRAAIASLALAGCTLEIPEFLGREGTGGGTFNLNREEAPTPVPVPLLSARADRGLHGVIIRAEGVAPTQGYYGGALAPLEPQPVGQIAYLMTALPPTGPEQVGPQRTRTIPVATFLTNAELANVRSIRVTGGANTITLPLR